MSEYRDPDEDVAQAAHEQRVQAVLDEAVRHGAMLQAAIVLGEPPDVVELWIDKFWNGLRDNLSDNRPDYGPRRLRQEDRLAAIKLLLVDRIAVAAEEILGTAVEPGEAPDA